MRLTLCSISIWNKMAFIILLRTNNSSGKRIFPLLHYHPLAFATAAGGGRTNQKQMAWVASTARSRTPYSSKKWSRKTSFLFSSNDNLWEGGRLNSTQTNRRLAVFDDTFFEDTSKRATRETYTQNWQYNGSWEDDEEVMEDKSGVGYSFFDDEEEEILDDGVDIARAVSTDNFISVEKSDNVSDDAPPSPPSLEPETDDAIAPDTPSTPTQNAGYGITDDIPLIKRTMTQLEQEMFSLHGTKFNPNSPKQAAQVLFGKDAPNSSTARDELENLSSRGNRMAALILEYRKCLRQIRKIQTRNERTSQRFNIPQKEETYDPLIIVDASACIFRSYYAMPPMHRSDGTPISAVLGVCNMINRQIFQKWSTGSRPRIVFAFDCPKSRQTFRHFLYEEYKSHRPPCPMDLKPQFALVKEMATAYGIPFVEAPVGYEADDVIATLATRAVEEELDVDILSGDKDLMQLITPQNSSFSINMVDPQKGTRTSYLDVVEKFGVPPEQLVDVFALAGDSSDNIPGVPKIGIKIASQLIREFGDLDTLLEKAETDVPQKKRRENLLMNKDEARLSRDLVQLECAIEPKLINMTDLDSMRNLKIDAFDKRRLIQYYQQMGFRDLESRTERRLSGEKVQRSNGSFRKKESKPPLPSEYNDVPF